MSDSPWYKRAWVWVAAGVVLVVALVIWAITRRQSGWAAEKILRIQGDTEEKVIKIQEQTQQSIKKLDTEFIEGRKAIKQKEQRQIAKVKAESARLNEAALKRKVLDDLDDPL